MNYTCTAMEGMSRKIASPKKRRKENDTGRGEIGDPGGK
jgi:hypothetical protein